MTQHGTKSTLRLSLSHFQLAIERAGVFLKSLAELINHAGFLLPSDVQQKFAEGNQHYQQLHADYEKAIKIYNSDRWQEEKTFQQDLIKAVEVSQTFAQSLRQYIDDLLQNGRGQLETETLNLSLATVQKILQDLPALPPKENKVDGADYQANHTVVKAKVDQAMKRWMNVLQMTEKSVLENFHCSQLEEKGSIFIRLGPERLTTAKTEQLKLYQLRANIYSFTALDTENVSAVFDKMPLTREDYQDLALYAAILKPSAVVSALEQKYHQLQKTQQNHRQRLQQLKQQLGRHFADTLRVQRALDLHRKWLVILQQQANRSQTEQLELSQVMALKRLLTYQKKAFFKTHFQQQKALDILKALQDFCQQADNKALTGKNICAELLKKRKELQNEILQKQKVLLRYATSMQHYAASGLLSIEQQPNFQLGKIAAQSMSRGLEAYPKLPVLSHQLPPDLQEKLNLAVGSSFLGSSLWFSSWIGYSYQFIATINHILLAQHDGLMAIGDQLETIAHKTYLPVLDYLEQQVPHTLQPVVQQLKTLGRYDEQGLIEKEKWIQWLTGLGVLLIISGGQHLLPGTVAYILATGCGEVAMMLVEKFSRGQEFKTETTALLKTFAHIATYATVFPFTFRQVHAYTVTPAPLQRYSPTEALKLFGFTTSPTEKVLKERYRQLALENHPDKCGTACDAPMADINEAYEVLTKKLR